MTIRAALGPSAPSRASACAALTLALLSSSGHTQTRRFADIEPLTLHRDARDNSRVSLAVAGAAFGFSDSELIPYVGAGIGLLTLQARLGLLYVPSGLAESGFVARFEARPNIPTLPCFEPALFAHIGAGYRWQLESGPRGSVAGPGLSVIPAFEGGPAWIKRTCTDQRPGDAPSEGTFFFGGTVALALDF